MTQGSTTEGPTRREIMLGGAALALASSATAHAQDQARPAAATATGTITEIVPGSAPGAKGPPLPNILVSNGREVVSTGADGRYSLSVAPGQSIFVVKPAGFRLPIDAATNLVRYSYVYDPDGTPAVLGFRYTGIAPTGPLPATIDFELTRVEEPARFDVLLMTDPQPETTAELEYVRDDVISGLFGTDAAFGMTLGDLMFDDLSLYHRYNRIVATLGLPWWNVGGNHDLDYEAPDGTRARDTWKRVFGAPYYAHEHANALFIMLDNVDYLGLNTGKEAGVRGAYRGRFSADQLTFVKNLLAATPQDKLIVLAFHIPLRTYLDPKDPANNTDNTGDLLALLGDRPSVSFCGHTHSTEHHYLGADDGFPNRVAHHHHVLAAASGSWWSGPLDHRGIACADQWDGTPNGTHVLSVDGNVYTTRFVPAAEPAGSRMRISLQTQNHQSDREVMREVAMDPLLRSPITSDQADGTRVVVNVFDGGPRTRVSYALDDGHQIEMQRVAKVDPFVAQLYGRYPDTIKKWVTPQHCSHLFAARLPAGLRPGTYALKVAATDEYGRQLSNGMVLEVV